MTATGCWRAPSSARRRPRSSTPATLVAQLRDIRVRGYAQTLEELEEGLNAVAAPVRGADGQVIAALSRVGPGVPDAPGGPAAGRAAHHGGRGCRLAPAWDTWNAAGPRPAELGRRRERRCRSRGTPIAGPQTSLLAAIGRTPLVRLPPGRARRRRAIREGRVVRTDRLGEGPDLRAHVVGGRGAWRPPAGDDDHRMHHGQRRHRVRRRRGDQRATRARSSCPRG